MKKKTNKNKDSIYTILLNFVIVVIMVWVVFSNLVYTFINHGQTQLELTFNFWNAITCQWHRNVYDNKEVK
jgi:ABC-type uncharacterized transport system permease subunit